MIRSSSEPSAVISAPACWKYFQCVGKITRTNADRRRAVGKGVPANFFAFYEIDGDESKHNLSLDDYSCENDVIESGKWVLLK